METAMDLVRSLPNHVTAPLLHMEQQRVKMYVKYKNMIVICMCIILIVIMILSPIPE
jgi:hypothetical protein